MENGNGRSGMAKARDGKSYSGHGHNNVCFEGPQVQSHALNLTKFNRMLFPTTLILQNGFKPRNTPPSNWPTFFLRIFMLLFICML